MNAPWKLNQHPGTAVGIAVILLAIAAVIVIRTRSAAPPPTRFVTAYYYDLDTRQLFTDDGSRIPPITSPTGGQAVRAHVVSCGACTEDQRDIAFLEMYEPQAQKLIAAATPEQLRLPDRPLEEALRTGRLIRRPQETAWRQADSSAITAILESYNAKCPNGTVQSCAPDSTTPSGPSRP